jgi:hypothetical protein
MWTTHSYRGFLLVTGAVGFPVKDDVNDKTPDPRTGTVAITSSWNLRSAAESQQRYDPSFMCFVYIN